MFHSPSNFQQMEKRSLSLYDAATFAKENPIVGSTAPDLQMTDLDGKPVRLSSFSGKTIVLTKAGYT
jgi:peroxiredoxin